LSLDAQDWVWNHSQSKGTARLVLLAIADKAYGTDCSAYAGTTMLVQRSNAARSSVVAAVDKLIEIGELAVIEGRIGPRGETFYALPKAKRHRRSTNEGGPDFGPVQNPDRSENRTGTESGRGGSENRTGGGPESGPHNAEQTQAPLEEDSSSPASQADEPNEQLHLEAFGAFWLTYPKRKAKEEAKKAWIAAIKRGADPQRIVAAAKAYTHERHGQDAKFTKYPATWLNKGCYDDEPDPQPAPGRPHLKAVSGGWQPYQQPDQSAYDNDLGHF
jgi:hypothetical protein